MRRQLAFVSVTVATLVVLAALIPLATLVRNQARDEAISAAETDAQAIAAALAVAASIEPNAPLTEELAVELIAGFRDLGELTISESALQSMATALVAAASMEPGEGVTVEHAEAVIEAFRNREGVSIIFPDGSARGAPYAERANVDRAREGVRVTAETPEGAEVLVPVLVADVLTEEATVVVRAAVFSADMNRGVAPPDRAGSDPRGGGGTGHRSYGPIPGASRHGSFGCGQGSGGGRPRFSGRAGRPTGSGGGGRSVQSPGQPARDAAS